jgi:hypothetical protein
LSERIANLILEQLDVAAVELTIRKPDIWGGNGIPVVTLKKERLPTRLNLLDFDVQGLLSGLVYSGGYAMPILPEARRLALLAEAETYQYVRQPEEVSSGKVREQVSSVEELPRTSLFQRLKEDFSDLIRFKLGVELVRYFPIYPFNFTELSLQLYETGSIGITPHLDGLSMLNLICIFTLTGQAKFALCDDRAGTNPHYLDTTPGNVTLLRSPGFEGSNFQPFHFVSDVTERRIVFGLRQKHQTSIKK